MSKFVIAILLFVLINLLAAKSLSVPVDTEYGAANDIQEHTWTEWALQDFIKQEHNQTPIVTIGSSLVLTPINLADANFLNHTVDGALHHHSALLEHLSHMSNFNFALPGLMPSDTYLITKLLLSNKEHPQLIIYGVGPRDFLDNLLASPSSTDPYHCLAGLLKKVGEQKTTSLYQGNNWQSKLDYFLSEHLPIYGQREELITMLSGNLDRLFKVLHISEKLALTLPERFSIAKVQEILPRYNPMIIGVNQCLFVPNPEVDPERFTKNYKEYQSRYGKINWDTFACQTTFFLDFLKLTKANKTKVLVVSMPITSINRRMLPDYILSMYKNNLRVLSKPYGADFIDLDSSGRFSDQDFGDTVHLNTAGSIKFVDLIADYLIEHKTLLVKQTDRSQLAGADLKL